MKINMRKGLLLLFLAASPFINSDLLKADDANATQFLTIVKQTFGDVKDVYIFISESDFSQEKSIIDRAALQNGLTPHVFIIKTSIDVNTNIKNIPDNGVLVVYQSAVMSKKSTILYMLSKCKKKQIGIVSSSKEYSELGAVLGLVKENRRFKIILNLKQNDWLAPLFTEDKRVQIGVSEVIE